MEESRKPTFVIFSPNFLGLPVNQDEERIEKYLKSRSTPKIKSFYVHGQLEDDLGFDCCTFVSGEIQDVEFQNAKIFDVYDKSHDAKIVLVHVENNIYGYLVSPEEDLKEVQKLMVKLIERYGSI
jgi:hypothetical protein